MDARYRPRNCVRPRSQSNPRDFRPGSPTSSDNLDGSDISKILQSLRMDRGDAVDGLRLQKLKNNSNNLLEPQQSNGSMPINKDMNFESVVDAIGVLVRNQWIQVAAYVFLTTVMLVLAVQWTGTQYTPLLDVCVYCIIYAIWITVYLPWLVVNVDGKLLLLMLGAVLRLFAADLGVMVWAYYRGHRDVLQRGLRLKPVFEPTMQWLSDAGYNLRYGVVVASLLGSLLSVALKATGYINYYVCGNEEEAYGETMTPPDDSPPNMDLRNQGIKDMTGSISADMRSLGKARLASVPPKWQSFVSRGRSTSQRPLKSKRTANRFRSYPVDFSPNSPPDESMNASVKFVRPKRECCRSRPASGFNTSFSTKR